MPEQILDVKGSWRLIRRFWRTVAVFILIGLVAGAGYEVSRPTQYKATSLVLLPAASASTTSGSSAVKNDVTTDGRIATSAAVLVPAGREVDPSLSMGALQQRVSTRDAAVGVLGITATGSTPLQAEALTNAVARHLVTFVTTNGSSADVAALAGLQAEANQLNKQISNVQAQITAANLRLAAEGLSPAAGQEDSDLVGQLTSQQSSLGLQLNTVKSQIAQAKLGQISANQGTEVIQQATDAVGPKVTAPLLTSLVGAIGGALVGSLVVLARHRKDPRLWTRDALAEGLGSPVVLSLNMSPRRTTGDWVSLLKDYQPSSLEEWNVRKALRELGVGQCGGSSLVVLGLAGDTAGVAQAAQLALSAVGSGLDTVFSLVAEVGSVPGLQGACIRFEAEGGHPRSGLAVHSGLPPQRNVSPDLTVTAVVVDQSHPTLPIPREPGTVTVLSVSAGFASAEQLARVAIAAADGGEPLKGILVANPDPRDQTVGRFPDVGAWASLVAYRRALGVKPGVASGTAR